MKDRRDLAECFCKGTYSTPEQTAIRTDIFQRFFFISDRIVLDVLNGVTDCAAEMWQTQSSRVYLHKGDVSGGNIFFYIYKFGVLETPLVFWDSHMLFYREGGIFIR